jgi:hypothetical protein
VPDLHNKRTETRDGIVTFALNLFRCWTTQIETAYAGFTETEKESGRQKVRRSLPLIEKALTDQREAGLCRPDSTVPGAAITSLAVSVPP